MRIKYGEQGRCFYQQHLQSPNSFYNTFTKIISLISKKIPSVDYSSVKQIYSPQLNLLESYKIEYNGYLYIFGGYTRNSTSNNNHVYRLNLETSTIETVSSIPVNCAKHHCLSIYWNHNVLILSGQVEEGYGKSMPTMYQYCLITQTFKQLSDLPFNLYCAQGYIQNKILTVFSGVQADRTTPNDQIWEAEIIDENDKLISDPQFKLREEKFVGSCHSSTCRSGNQLYYLGGCNCHCCIRNRDSSSNSYTHDNFNYTIDLSQSWNPIRIDNFVQPVSHVSGSTWLQNEIIYVVGGQLPRDRVYMGLQLYYTKLNLWIELTVDPAMIQYFNKGCLSLMKLNQLYLTSGQFGNDKGESIGKFNDTLLVFEFSYL
jgi:hypothetical protein